MRTKLKECIVCGGKTFGPYCDDVVRCQSCRLVVAEEIPTAAEVDKLYQEEYFFGMEYSDYEADRPALEYNFKQRIRAHKDMLQKSFDIIEVGCAYGYFLNLVKDNVHSHIGFDVSKDGIAFAKKNLGVNATTKDFLSYKFKPNSVDSIFMWDVAEHLTEPDRYFEKIAEILKKGGKLTLTTGDVDAIVPRIRKGKWRMVHPPTHVYYFSPKTISRLLAKYDLKVEDVKHHGVSRNVGSVFNQLIANRKALKKTATPLDIMYRLSKLVRADKLNIPLNTFDIMEVTAVKP